MYPQTLSMIHAYNGLVLGPYMSRLSSGPMFSREKELRMEASVALVPLITTAALSIAVLCTYFLL
uniref:Uncharacterized protein n=1 Tax=Amphimedon queenslandica TaxID=400682 RepID=A0A1X7U999_AMPQE